MAAGVQSVANGGVHLRPYLVERVEDANGELYRHQLETAQVLTPDVALRAVDTLKGVLVRGTARRTPLDGDRPAGGKTGTQDNNTNAWFVGFTKQMSAAVWVGDPKGYTPMVNIPEFVREDSITRVQGSMYPARIWKAFMDPIHADLPVLDWDAPPVAVATATRLDVTPKRIYLPGNECLARVVSGTIPQQATPGSKQPTTTMPAEVTPNTVVVSVMDPGTTISPSDTNPYSPVNTLPIGEYLVYDCNKPFPASVQTVVGQ
jgi:penicillin-binding protein 1A